MIYSDTADRGFRISIVLFLILKYDGITARQPFKLYRQCTGSREDNIVIQAECAELIAFHSFVLRVTSALPYAAHRNHDDSIQYTYEVYIYLVYSIYIYEVLHLPEETC